MLRQLEIRDMLIIPELSMEFREGLNVLTGETGAGKSILLDCLGFVLGWRGRAELVRQGAGQGEVTAVFELAPGHPAREILQEAGLPAGDELILRRVNTPDGRKTAWVNDRRASGEVLRQLSAVLVELHGQGDDRGLTDPRIHRDLLDDYGGLGAARAALRSAWSAYGRARRAREEAEAKLAEIRAEEEFLRHAAGELGALDPQPGEEAELDARRRMMQSAGRVREDIGKAAAILGIEGAEGALTDAQRWLEGAAGDLGEALDPPLAALSRAMSELGEAAQGVERVLDALDFDPSELESTEERLFAIRAQARKHGVLPEDLPELAARLTARLAELDGGAAGIGALARAEEEARAAYDAAAAELTAARRAAAGRLDAAVAAELAPLKMERAVFTTEITEAAPGPDGCDTVTFTAATNPGAPAGPLGRVASGGELSRFLLALKVCLAGQAEGLTMIFDEIDRGVGGATADAVGKRLSALADPKAGAQVLAVTHSPQVAARGDHHWRVEKRVEGGMTSSAVVPLDAAERVSEIARMLSGDTVTSAAREAARALLQPGSAAPA